MPRIDCDAGAALAGKGMDGGMVVTAASRRRTASRLNMVAYASAVRPRLSLMSIVLGGRIAICAGSSSANQRKLGGY